MTDSSACAAKHGVLSPSSSSATTRASAASASRRSMASGDTPRSSDEQPGKRAGADEDLASEASAGQRASDGRVDPSALQCIPRRTVQPSLSPTHSPTALTSRSHSPTPSTRGSLGGLSSRSAHPPSVPKLPLHQIIPAASKEKGPVYLQPDDFSGRHHTGETDSDTERTPKPAKLRLPIGWCTKISQRTGKPYYWKDGEHAATVTWIHPAKALADSQAREAQASADVAPSGENAAAANASSEAPPASAADAGTGGWSWWSSDAPAASQSADAGGSWFSSLLCRTVTLDEGDRGAWADMQANQTVHAMPVLKATASAPPGGGRSVDRAPRGDNVTPQGLSCQMGWGSFWAAKEAAQAAKGGEPGQAPRGKVWAGVTSLRRPQSQHGAFMAQTHLAHNPGDMPSLPDESGDESRSTTPKAHLHVCPLSL